MTVPLILSILCLIVIDKMRKTTRIESEHLTNLSLTLECPSEGWQKHEGAATLPPLIEY